MLLAFGAVLLILYFLLAFIPPQSGPLHWIVVLVVVLAGIGLGVLNRPRRSGVQP
jgi:hypothetical protein